jgi:hypothetical protein
MFTVTIIFKLDIFLLMVVIPAKTSFKKYIIYIYLHIVFARTCSDTSAACRQKILNHLNYFYISLSISSCIQGG